MAQADGVLTIHMCVEGVGKGKLGMFMLRLVAKVFRIDLRIVDLGATSADGRYFPPIKQDEETK